MRAGGGRLGCGSRRTAGQSIALGLSLITIKQYRHPPRPLSLTVDACFAHSGSIHSPFPTPDENRRKAGFVVEVNHTLGAQGPGPQYLGPYHDQIQLRYKVRILSQHMDHVVLQATLPVHIPKGLPGQMLHDGVVRRRLPADDAVFLSHRSFSIWYGRNCALS